MPKLTQILGKRISWITSKYPCVPGHTYNEEAPEVGPDTQFHDSNHFLCKNPELWAGKPLIPCSGLHSSWHLE